MNANTLTETPRETYEKARARFERYFSLPRVGDDFGAGGQARDSSVRARYESAAIAYAAVRGEAWNS